MVPPGCVIFSLVVIAHFISQSHQTPVHNHLQADSPLCPPSWYQYRKFCVTSAPLGTERAVALYCHELGGIGVNGICVIKAFAEPEKEVDDQDEQLGPINLTEFIPLLSRSDLTGAAVEGIGLQEDGVNSLDARENTEEANSPDAEGVCPAGWSHYHSLCVYRPWAGQQSCRNYGAVHLQGMCLKHADTRTSTKVERERNQTQEKRICCCAHVNARANSYGC